MLKFHCFILAGNSYLVSQKDNTCRSLQTQKGTERTVKTKTKLRENARWSDLRVMCTFIQTTGTASSITTSRALPTWVDDWMQLLPSVVWGCTFLTLAFFCDQVKCSFSFRAYSWLALFFLLFGQHSLVWLHWNIVHWTRHEKPFQKNKTCNVTFLLS